MQKKTKEVRLLPLTVSSSDESNIIREKIICVRPARKLGIRVEKEAIENKTVIHCYGHGGSGWTLAPGTTERAVALLSDSSKNKDITIVGAGIIGCMCAYNLLKLKEKKNNLVGEISIIAERNKGITSEHAGGLFEPVAIGRGGTGSDDDLINSYLFYRNIALGLNPDFSSFDSELLPLFSSSVSSTAQKLIDKGELPPAVQCSVNVNGKEQKWVMTQLFFMNVIPFYDTLTEFLLKSNVKIHTGVSITDFNQVSTSTIFNCTGLGAAKLNNDDEVVPYTGHLITLRNQSRGLLDINNTSYIEKKQISKVKECISEFNEVFKDFSFDGKELDAMLDSLHDAHSSILKLLVNPKIENDPDWSEYNRVRIFKDTKVRDLAVFQYSKVISALKYRKLSTQEKTATDTYVSMVNTYSKRYMFGIVGNYPNREEILYHGDSYAFPLLQNELIRNEDNSYNYVGEPNTKKVAVYVAGGTYISGHNLPMKRNEQEFQRIIDRLKFLGF